MKKLLAFVTTSNALSRTAMEEASRVGQRLADIDHLLLALVLDEGTAGQVLRREGITLDATRKAVADEHAQQLAGLGVDASWPEQGRIVYHETGGYDWSERALTVLKRAGDDHRGDYAAAVLDELMGEPSGLIAAVLERLGTSPAIIRAALHEVLHIPGAGVEAREGAQRMSATRESFVPAPVDRVWALLADPESMPRWDPSSVAAVTGAPEPPAAVGDTWKASAPTHSPAGKRLRIRPEYATQHVQLVQREEGRTISWRHTYPQAPTANSKVVAVVLEPVAGGTRVRVTVTWERHPRRQGRGVLALIGRPWVRLVLPLQASSVGAGIARAFR